MLLVNVRCLPVCHVARTRAARRDTSRQTPAGERLVSPYDSRTSDDRRPHDRADPMQGWTSALFAWRIS
jgi:hypothetical protein